MKNSRQQQYQEILRMQFPESFHLNQFEHMMATESFTKQVKYIQKIMLDDMPYSTLVGLKMYVKDMKFQSKEHFDFKVKSALSKAKLRILSNIKGLKQSASTIQDYSSGVMNDLIDIKQQKPERLCLLCSFFSTESAVLFFIGLLIQISVIGTLFDSNKSTLIANVVAGAVLLALWMIIGLTRGKKWHLHNHHK